MDSYTSDTRKWLDRRFRQANADGIYRAHQPIYGFRVPPSDGEYCERYSLTYLTLKALSFIKFSSFLDVGGAEGYKAALVRDTFSVKVRSCDLSGEACARARELYGVEGEAVDTHKLHYGDGEFDVVLSSETLEHVTDIESAARELLRVAKKALVITVPHEPPEVIEENIRLKIPHAHIHSLNANSFDFLYDSGVRDIFMSRCLSPFTRIPFIALNMSPRPCAGVNETGRWLYNKSIPLIKQLFGEWSARAAVRMDHAIAKRDPRSRGMVFTCIKDPDAKLNNPSRSISIQEVIRFRVPPLPIVEAKGS